MTKTSLKIPDRSSSSPRAGASFSGYNQRDPYFRSRVSVTGRPGLRLCWWPRWSAAGRRGSRGGNEPRLLRMSHQAGTLTPVCSPPPPSLHPPSKTKHTPPLHLLLCAFILSALGEIILYSVPFLLLFGKRINKSRLLVWFLDFCFVFCTVRLSAGAVFNSVFICTPCLKRFQ